MAEVFLDTSFAIALSSVTDRNHSQAVKLANQIETNKTRLVTTQAILLEKRMGLSGLHIIHCDAGSRDNGCTYCRYTFSAGRISSIIKGLVTNHATAKKS